MHFEVSSILHPYYIIEILEWTFPDGIFEGKNTLQEKENYLLSAIIQSYINSHSQSQILIDKNLLGVGDSFSDDLVNVLRIYFEIITPEEKEEFKIIKH
ncbi:hypothetical protein CEXT_541251 [Caerostris extrusa]|uniref:Uncharacterized protein n=1 Tax=Caerostris extrusa TaxID=172846 RepID=A0AAV4YGC4_CAEEX|nr:hypothetical protein CEXT_541251 [Caerostris extrusa]